ncbi:MAG: hypothetical protein HYU99_10430 [Deltaproteobacteria bacterium]|nr:hypothetical protein [Deltaproteobacteria bacterium]
MTAVTRGKGIIEGVSMIPAGGPLPKGNYLFVHLSFDENGPSATGAAGLNPRLVGRALFANPTLDLSPDLFRRVFCDVLEEDFFRGKERSSHGWPSLTWPELEQRLKETDFNRPSVQPFGAVMAVGIYGQTIRSISVTPLGKAIPAGDNYACIHLSFDETGVRVTDVRGRNKDRLRILLAENRSLKILPGDFFNEKDPDGLMPTAEELERDQGKAGGPPVNESPGRSAGDETNEISSAEAAVAINYVQTLPPYNHRSGEPQGSSHRRDYLRDMETGMERDIQWHKAGAEYFDLEVTDPESARKILNEMRKKASERKEGFMGLVAVRASGDAVGFREFVVSPNENGLGVAFSEIYILSGHRKKGYRTLVDSVIIASLLSGMKGKGELKVQYVKVHNPDNRRKYEAAGLKNISPPGVEYPSYEITHSAADFRARLDSTEGGSDSFPAPPLTLGPGYFKWDPSDLPLTPDRFTERLGRIRQKLAGLVLDVAQGMKKLQRPQSFWKGDVDLLHKRLAQIREELGSFYLLLDKRYPHEQFSDGAKALQGEMETIRREMDELEAQIIVMKQADILKQVERELEDELDLFERLREVCEDEKEPLSPESAGRFQRDIGEIEQRLRIMGVLNSGNEDIKRQGESVLVRLSSLRRRVEALADVKNGAAGDRGDEDWELIDDEK